MPMRILVVDDDEETRELVGHALAREGYATLAVLAGPDAVGFLRFAAANEDDLELQREAERALSAALAGSGERVPSRSHGVDLPRVARGHRQ